MSLPGRQRRALDAIENALEASEPRINGMFTMFARLARGEEPVATERLPRRRLTWLRQGSNVVLIPALAVLLLMTGLVIGMASRGASACGAAFAGARAGRSAAACAAPGPAPVPPSPLPPTWNTAPFRG
jgi:hypothetical protein